MPLALAAFDRRHKPGAGRLPGPRIELRAGKQTSVDAPTQQYGSQSVHSFFETMLKVAKIFMLVVLVLFAVANVFIVMKWIGADAVLTDIVTGVIGAALACVAILRTGDWIWGELEEEEESPANRRAEHRVLAWTSMPLTVMCRGEKIATTVLNVSLGGMALHWEEPHAPAGTIVQMHVEGYLVLPAMVIAEGGGFIRLKYTADVPDIDRRRLRSDCVAGIWGAPVDEGRAAQAQAQVQAEAEAVEHASQKK